MTEREELINKLKYLHVIDREKQKQYQKQTNSGPECGFLTREAMQIASLLPKMQSLGITFNDITILENE